MRDKVIVLFMSIVSLTGCKEAPTESQDTAADNQEVCSCPPTVIMQPCDNFTQDEAHALVPRLKAVIKESAHIELDFEVKPPLSLHDSLLNEKHSRYRADKIIRSMEDNGHDAVIVLTHHDISCTYKGREDWGILGLSMSPKHVCVASDYRLKNKKRDLWKVAAHEFFHSYCNMRHCENDDPSCIMKDAKGHADFSNKNHLCKSCQPKCNI